MCFSIPRQVIKVSKNTALLDDHTTVLIDPQQIVTIGTYVQVQGNVITAVLSKREGKKIRVLIKQINTTIMKQS